MLNGVEIQLEGKARKLAYNYQTIADMEEAMNGQSVIAMIGNPDKLGLHAIRMFVMYGLRHEERAMTKQRAGAMLQKYFDDGGDYLELIDAITQALIKSGAFGKQDLESAAEGNVTGAE
jgi:hypothetical protein